MEKQEDYKNEEPVFHRAKLGKTETESRISTNNRFNKWNFKPQGFICVLSRRMKLLEFRKEGIYCEAGDFYIDPMKSVSRAVITHAHSDHARAGMKSYLTHTQSREVLRLRLGKNLPVETVGYNEPVFMGPVKLSFHPSGHLPGASQVRVEYKGEVWVASGDYKTDNDGLSEHFEAVKCHTFITESTFGLPIFRWKPQEETGNEILQWWQRNQEYGHASILFAYSLGKAQRLIHMLHDKGIVAVHPTIFDTNAALRKDGVAVPEVRSMATLKPEEWKKALLISPNVNGIPESVTCRTANCSGWMTLSRFRSRGNADAGFVLSDHADWPGLLSAITGTGAENIIVNHGYTTALSRYLTEKGWNAMPAPNHNEMKNQEILTERG